MERALALARHRSICCSTALEPELSREAENPLMTALAGGDFQVQAVLAQD
jgi:hypothetical protein